MSAFGLESIEYTVQLTHKWINDLDAHLGWDDKHRSFRLLRPCSRHYTIGCRSTWQRVLARSRPELLRGLDSITNTGGLSRHL